MIGLGFLSSRRHTTAPSAPVIVAVTLSPLPATVGVPITCSVSYTGWPRPGPTFQWQLGGINISGATGASYTPVSGDGGGALTCEAAVNNGVGTASGESAPATVQTTGSLYVDAGYVDAGYVLAA